jgi:hypothetical protein
MHLLVLLLIARGSSTIQLYMYSIRNQELLYLCVVCGVWCVVCAWYSECLLDGSWVEEREMV